MLALLKLFGRSMRYTLKIKELSLRNYFEYFPFPRYHVFLYKLGHNHLKFFRWLERVCMSERGRKIRSVKSEVETSS